MEALFIDAHGLKIQVRGEGGSSDFCLGVQGFTDKIPSFWKRAWEGPMLYPALLFLSLCCLIIISKCHYSVFDQCLDNSFKQIKFRVDWDFVIITIA